MDLVRDLFASKYTVGRSAGANDEYTTSAKTRQRYTTLLHLVIRFAVGLDSATAVCPYPKRPATRFRSLPTVGDTQW